MIGAITAGLFAGGVPAVTNSYESIASVTLGTTTDYITFSSISGDYKHLQLRWLLRGTRASAADSIFLQFNSDTSSYPRHYLIGQGDGSAYAYGEDSSAGNAGMTVRVAPAASSTSSVYGAGICDISDYANGNKYKTVRTLAGYDANGSGEVALNSGVWLSTSAITQIRIASSSLGDWGANSQVALYGIKG
jgi:hypothetical protein